MYEDSWYSFVSDVAASKPVAAAVAAPPSRRRNESRVQPPEADALPAKLQNDFEDDEATDDDSPPEPELRSRAASLSHLFDGLHLDEAARTKTKLGRADDRRWEALHLFGAARADDIDGPLDDDPQYLENRLLDSSQQNYLLYQDQLTLTERHLDGLIGDANAALDLLSTLSRSFQSVEAQTTSFRSQCEGLLNEQHRLERLADEVGTDLHYYAYLDMATRRLNAPGASRLVEDDGFGDMVTNIDACIGFMNTHASYRERDSYLARYNALLTKALHLLDHGFTARLESISADVGRQIAATKSETARHALAFGRFEEMLADSYALLPNVRKVVSCAYDEYGRPVESSSSLTSVYANSAATMFRTYLVTRDRHLKLMTQHDADEFQKQVKTLSVETACRNYIKQSLDKVYDEDGLFSNIFGIDPAWSSAADSAFQVVKAIHTSMAHPGHLTPLATAVQNVLQTCELQAVCNVVGWLAREYSISESDDDEPPASRRYREYAARLLVDHLWLFTDGAFAAEVARTMTKATVDDAALKTDGVSKSNAFAPVGQAIKLLAMFDQGMPKERSAKNSVVVFNIVRETIRILQRAEARIRSLKTGTDADLFMIQNILMLKNELFSLEIGDIRSQPQSMQHFGRIWDTLSPQNWVGFFSSILGGSLWTRSTPTVTAKTLTAEDMSEQLDELLRQSIYAFTRRWGALMDGAQSRAAGAKPLAKVEAELEGLLRGAFESQPEVVAKLREAIRLNAQAQTDAREAKRGAKRY
ncbi:golgi complex component Cog3 [Ophiocordyceps camponoti-floridani]|uniref:Conserved oligomeric Golgi complex subunit 3 n=1 Tax=Ophiocordyceps camponoti-floridani TaxID=2030778 RepID=A0A8H4Q7T7_9HYPO|nr:golgi complex component Cog3 [Ophiocordyceps camponoti-floridani]